MLLLSAATVTVPALAIPFVTAGSSYSFYLEGGQSGNPFEGVASFDGIAQYGNRNGVILTANESEQALGNGQSRVTFNLTANGSLFTLDDASIIFGIGTDQSGNGFNFETSVNLLSATIILFNEQGDEIDRTTGLETGVDQTIPWNGLFLGINNNIELGGIDAASVTGIRAEFVISAPSADVPEPNSVLLSGIGLLAGVIAMRRRRHSK